MSWLFDRANDTEKQVASILLELSTLITANDAAAQRRSPINEISVTAPPPSPYRLLASMSSAADRPVASEFETFSCRGGNDDKSVTDDQRRTPFIQENSSEINAASYIPPPGIRKNKIKVKLPRPKRSPQACFVDQSEQIIKDEQPHSPRAKEEFDDGMAQPAEPERHLVRESRAITADPATVLEANNFIHRKKPPKRKSLEEMEKEVMFWEKNKLELLETKNKVNEHLEEQKALNLELKALKLKLSSR